MGTTQGYRTGSFPVVPSPPGGVCPWCCSGDGTPPSWRSSSVASSPCASPTNPHPGPGPFAQWHTRLPSPLTSELDSPNPRAQTGVIISPHENKKQDATLTLLFMQGVGFFFSLTPKISSRPQMMPKRFNSSSGGGRLRTHPTTHSNSKIFPHQGRVGPEGSVIFQAGAPGICLYFVCRGPGPRPSGRTVEGAIRRGTEHFAPNALRITQTHGIQSLCEKFTTCSLSGPSDLTHIVRSGTAPFLRPPERHPGPESPVPPKTGFQS